MKSKRNENRRTSVINSHNENQLNLFKTKCQSVCRLSLLPYHHVQFTKRCSTGIMYALDFLFSTADPCIRASCRGMHFICTDVVCSVGVV